MATTGEEEKKVVGLGKFVGVIFEVWNDHSRSNIACSNNF